MPIHVNIAVNERDIKVLHIGRAEGGADPDDVNTYIAVMRFPNEQVDWYGEDSIKFQHRYGDGIDVCVMKGLSAVIEAGKTNP